MRIDRLQHIVESFKRVPLVVAPFYQRPHVSGWTPAMAAASSVLRRRWRMLSRMESVMVARSSRSSPSMAASLRGPPDQAAHVFIRAVERVSGIEKPTR
jgi:hypothetical protein